MPSEISLPDILERALPQREKDSTADNDGPHVVILYNDAYHGMDEVVAQLQKATGYDFERCVSIMAEAHTRGRAIAYTGPGDECERVAGVLRQIRLQVETDLF